ncbi:hypothetical protein QOZ80_2AG0137770 [Eleusine coracana subsp. coracana]|nr:hypothetical protein QOZ80_2AG0137770 [Eleusine coracana subsp. coracana]
MERFDAAVKSITNMGVSKETAKRVLNKLLTVYDYNWEHIEADNYQTLADAILDELDSMAGKKKRAEKKHLDSDHCNKKLKMKERGQKPKSSFHSNGKREPAEVPCQQGEEDPNKKAIITQLQKPSTQVFLKEPKTETDLCESSSALPLGSQDKYSYETPLAVMCPQIPGLIPHRASQKFKGSVSQEGNMAYAHNSQAITYNKDYSTNFEFYCKICPLEKIKIDRNSDSPKAKVNPDPCKGHLIRKFIKECWRKCGCTRNCGNRVVQRGITCSLQVFLTPEGKGWGLRTAEKLPPGAFICEYVGEILTNTELYERNTQRTSNAKHTYPLNLNADWGTEGVLKDDEALCLDGTFYGNVARFINHRCFDGNLIGIPVEIETPDHHYYHLAFFTKRQVEPYEELTWDYEIDFEDVDHPIKAFKCRCGSEYCRDKRRISRSKSRAPALL